VNETDATILVTGLFDRWYTQLIRYAVGAMGRSNVAEDLVQDVIMQLYQVLRSGKDIEYPKARTLCVLRRAVTRQMEERSRFEQLDELQIAQSWFEEDTDASTHPSLLGVLSPQEEEVLLLRLEAMKYREIADRLGISMNFVNTHLAHALQKLTAAQRSSHPGETNKKRNTSDVHPEDTILLAYLDAELPKPAMYSTEQHLHNCRRCRAA
jgi:RNA polymerase sigma factor (sigma-70 family)